MKRKMPYSVPEDYFGNLQKRLNAIPSDAAHTQVAARDSQAAPARRFSPYLAVAAALAVAIVAGGILLRKSAAPASPGSEELMEYLIDSDLTLAQLEEAVYYYDE